MVTSEYIDVDSSGRMMNCSPTSYKIPNVHSIPRKFNVTLMKNHDIVRTIYSAKVMICASYFFISSHNVRKLVVGVFDQV